MSNSAHSTILPLLQQRYSTRAFTDEPVSREKLERLFHAAQWSASCFNEQPWRFVIAAKDQDPDGFERIASTLVQGNAWALKAPVLGIAIAHLKWDRNGTPNRWAQHDTGQSMALLSVQAVAEGLNVHQMGGFDVAKAVEVLHIPVDHEPMAAFAIGHPVSLDPPAERKRRPLESILFGGEFGKPL